MEKNVIYSTPQYQTLKEFSNLHIKLIRYQSTSIMIHHHFIKGQLSRKVWRCLVNHTTIIETVNSRNIILSILIAILNEDNLACRLA
jgi:hypothetical protein